MPKAAATDINVLVGARVRTLREQRGISQQRLAELSDISVDAVGKVERGVYSPTLDTLASLARGLDVSLAELVAASSVRDTPRVNPSRKRIQQLLEGATAEQQGVAFTVLRALLQALEKRERK